MRINIVFLEGLQPQNSFIMFLFSTKHPYLLTRKTTQDIDNSFWFLHGIKELLQAILCMSEATFGVWLWPQLSWCSMYMSRHYFVIKIYNIIHCYSNFLLFELPNGMSLIGSYLLPSLAWSLLLKRFFLLKKFIANLITNLFKASFI